jgi:hypothetical protein
VALSQELRRLRDLGVDFDTAWSAALPIALGASCDPSDWLHVLNVTRPGWERGYNREVSRRREIAAGVLNTPADGARTAELPCGVLVA